MVGHIGCKRRAEQDVSSLEEETHSFATTVPSQAASGFKIPYLKNKPTQKLKDMKGLTKEGEVLRQLSLLNES